MAEREPRKETICQGELFFLSHPGTEAIFSGYGLTPIPGTKEFLVGLLMVDRPADPAWLKEVEETFGECQLVAMTTAGERGIACQMQIEPGNLQHLRQYHDKKEADIQKALEPLLENPPKPAFSLYWDEKSQAWCSRFSMPAALPAELREVFERTGYGCLAAETNIGVVHVCHAAESDIEGFVNKSVQYQWQLIRMPTAPLIRLELNILDQQMFPFKFESFLNVAATDQARILGQLADQNQLYLVFYGDNLTHRFTKVVVHGERQRKYLDDLVDEAVSYWRQLSPEVLDFDKAKEEFMGKYI
jgi:hypothetical protein